MAYETSSTFPLTLNFFSWCKINVSTNTEVQYLQDCDQLVHSSVSLTHNHLKNCKPQNFWTDFENSDPSALPLEGTAVFSDDSELSDAQKSSSIYIAKSFYGFEVFKLAIRLRTSEASKSQDYWSFFLLFFHGDLRSKTLQYQNYFWYLWRIFCVTLFDEFFDEFLLTNFFDEFFDEIF